jgi:hypothetical protein
MAGTEGQTFPAFEIIPPPVMVKEPSVESHQDDNPDGDRIEDPDIIFLELNKSFE